MALQISIGKSQINDLAYLCDLGTEKLSNLITSLENHPIDNLRIEDLNKYIAEYLTDDIAAATIVRVSFALFSLNPERKFTNSEIIDAIHQEVKRSSKWDSDKIAKWEGIKPLLKKLQQVKIIQLASKALNLSYEYANLFRSARIVTDIRPLYSEDATTIDGAVISQTLRLRFESSDGEHEFSIAMDENDIESLKKQCDRALQKASIAKEKLKNMDIPTYISGDKDDD